MKRFFTLIVLAFFVFTSSVAFASEKGIDNYDNEDKVKEYNSHYYDKLKKKEDKEILNDPSLSSNQLSREEIKEAEILEFGKTLEEITKDNVSKLLQKQQISSDVDIKWTSDYDEYATSASTHRWITWKAKEILEGDDKTNWYWWANTYRTQLYKGSDDADEDGWPSYVYHFHDPDTNETYTGGSITAADYCENLFEDAVDCFGEDTEQSFYLLGKALHYLQDCNMPHHAANEVWGLSNHTDYENYCNDMKYDCEYTYGGYYDWRNFPWYYCDDAAVYAKARIEDVLDNDDQDEWEYVCRASLRRAQKTSAGLLGEFFSAVDEPES